MIVLKAAQDKVLGGPAVGGRHRRAAAHAADPGQRAAAQERRQRSSSPPATWRSRCAPAPSSAATTGSFATTVGARKLIDILRALPADQVVTPRRRRRTSSRCRAARAASRCRRCRPTTSRWSTRAVDFGPAFSVPQKTLREPDQPGALRDGGARHPLLPQRHPVHRRRQDARRWWPPTATAWRWRRRTLDAEVPSKQEVILPRKTVLELQRLLQGRGHADRDALRRQPGQVQLLAAWSSSPSWSRASSPTTTASSRRTTRTSSTLGRAPLLASLQRAAILTSEKFKGVRVNIEPGVLRIASSNAEQEEAKEELEIDYDGDAIEIGFNVTYLIDALANMSQEMVQARAAGQQRQRAVHRARAARLQVRGDADAHLSRLRPPASTPAAAARCASAVCPLEPRRL
ncbi:MAG: DNA polymerase III subunit beta [Comamonadaceae bacterium]|nr:DNA polymerase III subunit beta [Comamonadaceae bacterium]